MASAPRSRGLRARLRRATQPAMRPAPPIIVLPVGRCHASPSSAALLLCCSWSPLLTRCEKPAAGAAGRGGRWVAAAGAAQSGCNHSRKYRV